MPADAGPLSAGQRLAGCRVERLLAQGAHGALYAAIDEASGQPCALKLLTPAASPAGRAAESPQQRFRREAELAARLQHPGIVRLWRSGEDHGQPYLVLDLLNGCDLRRYVQRGRLLPEPVVLGVVARVASALACMHGHGLVHRDLKPANIMVDWATDRVTLTDLGIARDVDASVTATGLVLGSPAYMAPELLAGAPADARSDLYALGVLLYELLVGELPFDAPGLGALLQQVASQPAPPLQRRRPDLPAALADCVARLLAKPAAQRGGGALALADELHALAGTMAAGPAGGPAGGPKSHR